MNRKLTTAGLAVLGAASIIPASAQMAGVETKPWAVSAQLRAFYDDNYMTFPKQLREAPGFDDNTFGFDVSPSVSYNLRREQMTLGVSYLYTLRYYADREDSKVDHSHQFNAKFSQAFSERYSLDLKDSFVIAQEPSIIDPTISSTIPSRSEGDNLRNQAGIQFNANLMEHFGIALGYNNTIYDYQQDATDAAADVRDTQIAAGLTPVFDSTFIALNGQGSRSAVLDRVEHAISLDGNYQILPKTTLTLGYIYGITDYTSSDAYATDPASGAILTGSARDSQSHVVSIGARQQVNDKLSLSGRVGVQITTYDREDLYDDETGPYAEASGNWAYAQGSSLQIGIRHSRVPTDVRQTVNGLTADAEASSVFAALAHAISPKILLNVMAQFQHSQFGSGGTDVADNLFYGGINATYQFTPHISAELGYTYDRLDSDIVSIGGVERSFTRNRVYLGGRVTY